MSHPLSSVKGMELTVDPDHVAAGGCAGAVCVADADVGSLSDDRLIGRLRELGRARSKMEGLLAEAAAEMHNRVGGRAAAATMREQFGVSARQATADTELAASLGRQFPSTLAALRAGEITAGHARVIARVGADPDHADESELLEMARGVPVDLFGRMTRQYERNPRDVCAEHRRQHENRWASLVQDPDGSWRLSAHSGYDNGKRVSVAFNRMVRAFRNDNAIYGSRITGLTSQQRRADALANLITGEGPHRRPKTTLLVIADYDTVAGELRNLRYDDGMPVPPDRIAAVAADAKILPAFFNADGDPLWLGKAQRNASSGQRAILAARDGGCVVCASPTERCEPHHIEWFSCGGSTDIDNLVLLCERCHHLVHDDGWRLRHVNSRFELRPPSPPSPPQPHRHRGAGTHPRTSAHPRPQRNAILRT